MSTEGIYSTTASAVDTTVVLCFQTPPLDFTIRGDSTMVGPGPPRLKPLSCPEPVAALDAKLCEKLCQIAFD